mgnify:CR=1 FL=1
MQNHLQKMMTLLFIWIQADASKKHDLEEETKCTLTMSEYSFGGGMRAVIPARSILIDNSMDSRIAEVRNEFQFDGGEYDGR